MEIFQGPLMAIGVVLAIIAVAAGVLWLIVAENKRLPIICAAVVLGAALSVALKSWMPVVVVMVGIAFFIFYCHHKETEPLM